MVDLDDPDGELAVIEGANDPVVPDAESATSGIVGQCSGVEAVRVGLQLGEPRQDPQVRCHVGSRATLPVTRPDKTRGSDYLP